VREKKTMKKNTPLVLASLAAGLLVAAPVQAQISFSSYVSIGDSLAAGYESGSLVKTHQVNSVPALLARQAGVSGFQMPLISEPGIPTESTLVSVSPSIVIAPKSTSRGTPENLSLSRPYNNLAVPGATLGDALTKITDGGSGMHDLILRGLGPQIAQTVAQRPSFVTLWIGNNDVLRAAIAGRAIDNVTLTPAATFRTQYQQLVDTLRSQTSAKIVAANLPDVTSIPFVTTVPSVVLVNGQPVALQGPNGPLPTGSYVLLTATTLLSQGYGIPTSLGGRGPLPDEAFLDPAEVAAIKDRVAQNNQAIAQICSAAGIPVVDMNSLLNRAASEGLVVGGVTLTAKFLTGGLFSYDGVHPSDLGYAVVANEWIRVLNANGAALPEIDLAPFMGLGVAGERTLLRTPWAELSPEAFAGLMVAFPPLDRQ
jgi:lysophospholipase L1-like esterase